MKKKQKKQLRRKNHRSRHHIIPSSRGGNTSNENIKMLNVKEHQNYHTLFSNLTPDEIIELLVEHFWNGQWEWVHEALRRRDDEDV